MSACVCEVNDWNSCDVMGRDGRWAALRRASGRVGEEDMVREKDTGGEEKIRRGGGGGDNKIGKRY